MEFQLIEFQIRQILQGRYAVWGMYLLAVAKLGRSCTTICHFVPQSWSQKLVGSVLLSQSFDFN